MLKYWVLGIALGALPIAGFAQSSVPTEAPVENTEDAPAADAVANASTGVEPPSTEAAAPIVETIPLATPEAPPAPAEDRTAPQSRLMQEIVVTAQKRSENLKEVPLSVTALPAEVLDVKQVLTLQDLPKVTPGLTVTPQASFTSLFLRGVGSDAYALGDPLVVYYVDGVYIPFAQALFTDLGVIEQVEILKGPQGTLFGRNALGGAVKTTTRDPSMTDVEGKLGLTVANYDSTKATVYASIPLVEDRLAIGVAGLYKHADSYLNTRHTAQFVSLPDPHEEAFQIRLKYLPTDWLDLRLTYSDSAADDAAGYNVVTEPGPSLIATGYTGQDPRNARLDHDIASTSKNRIWLGDIAFHAPWVDIKLLGSYQDFRIITAVDFDGSDRPIAHFVNFPGISKVKTAELQFLSADEMPFSDWIETVFGAYYFDSHAGFRGGLNAAGFVCPDGSLALPTCGAPDILLGLGQAFAPLLPFAGSPINLGFVALLDTKSIAFYNQTKFTITDWMALTVGIRYQDEKRTIDDSQGTFRGSGDVYDSSMDTAYQQYGHEFNDTTKKLDPKAALSFIPDWDWLGEKPLLYASYQTATTSSTFNVINIIPGDRPEFVKAVEIEAYEVGYKSRLFDNLIDINTAAFYYDITDPQVQFISLLAGGAVTFENAERQRIKGAEVDFTSRVLPTLLNDSLILTGNATYLDAKYTSYKNGSGFTDQYVFQQGQDYSGNRVTRTPKVSYTIGLLETLPTASGSIELGVDYFYQGKIFFLAQNTDNTVIDAYGLLGAHVSYQYEPWDLRVTAFGQNLLNEDYNYALFILDFGKNETPAPLRTYGLKLAWNFQ